MIKPHPTSQTKFNSLIQKKKIMECSNDQVMRVIVCFGFVFAVMNLIQGVSGTVHTVGDSSGWAMATDYSTWASDKTFVVGDTLVFNYPSGHTVDEVAADGYKNCGGSKSISSDSSGATTITLKTAGPHYFICGAPGHCDGGMKLTVNVKEAAAATGGDATPAAAASPPSSSSDGTKSLSPPTAVDSPAGTTAIPATRTDATPRPSAAVAEASQPLVTALVGVFTAALLKWTTA